MTNILLTEEAFHELMEHLQPEEGVDYTLAGSDLRYIPGLGEVEIVEVTKHTANIIQGVPEEYRAELESTDACPTCGDVDVPCVCWVALLEDC